MQGRRTRGAYGAAARFPYPGSPQGNGRRLDTAFPTARWEALSRIKSSPRETRMNIIFIVGGCAIIFIVAYLTYGKFLAKKVFALDDSRKTPAVEINDGNDYVPNKKHMLLGQQFSAIAAAGPINGPILAGVMFGWVPALFWIVIGSIFIGGVHDMGALIASVRHKARSITDVIRMNVSKRAWIVFMIFIWITLVYIIVAFTDLTAGSFVGMVTLESGEKVESGEISRLAAEKAALDSIATIRFEGDNYIFAYSREGKMLSAGSPDLKVGQDMNGFVTADGKMLMREMIAAFSRLSCGGTSTLCSMPSIR